MRTAIAGTPNAIGMITTTIMTGITIITERSSQVYNFAAEHGRSMRMERSFYSAARIAEVHADLI
jgi:hypothetical protein